MQDKTLLKSQKNQIAKILSESGLSIDEFDWQNEPPLKLEWTEVSGNGRFFGKSQKLQHKKDGYYFHFDRADRSKFINKRWPASATGEQGSSVVVSWDKLLELLGKWAGLVANECSQSDLWKTTSSYEYFSHSDLKSDAGEYFSQEEKGDIRARLNEFRELVTDMIKLNESQYFQLNERLDYMSGALDRLDKVDWKGIAISTLMSAAITLNLDTSIGDKWFAAIEQTILLPFSNM